MTKDVIGRERRLEQAGSAGRAEAGVFPPVAECKERVRRGGDEAGLAC